MKDKNGKREFQLEEGYKRVCSILDFKFKHDVWTEPDKINTYRKAYARLAYCDRKLGRVVNISRFGEFATTSKWEMLSEDEWAQCMGYEMEETEKVMYNLAKEQGIDTQGYYSIADAKGISLKILTRQHAVKQLANISGENYPEMLGKVYIINVPWIFASVFKIISPMLDPQTVSKFHIFSGVPKEFKELFDLSLLPKEYGGERDIVVAYPSESKKFDEDLIQHELVL